jgi:hypothetical protein
MFSHMSYDSDHVHVTLSVALDGASVFSCEARDSVSERVFLARVILRSRCRDGPTNRPRCIQKFTHCVAHQKHTRRRREDPHLTALSYLRMCTAVNARAVRAVSSPTHFTTAHCSFCTHATCVCVCVCAVALCTANPPTLSLSARTLPSVHRGTPAFVSCTHGTLAHPTAASLAGCWCAAHASLPAVVVLSLVVRW